MINVILVIYIYWGYRHSLLQKRKRDSKCLRILSFFLMRFGFFSPNCANVSNTFKTDNQNSNQPLKCHNFSVIFKALANKGVIATIEDVVIDLEKEKSDACHARSNHTLQKSKLPKENLCKNGCKGLKQS